MSEKKTPTPFLSCGWSVRSFQETKAKLGLGPHFIRWLAPGQQHLQALTHKMASVSELTCIYWALILHKNEVMDEVRVTEDKINIFTKEPV